MKTQLSTSLLLASLLGCAKAEPPLSRGHDAVTHGEDEGSDPVRNAVVRLTGGGSACTGTLVADDLVLTSSHCWNSIRTSDASGVWLNFSSLVTVRIGNMNTGGVIRFSNQYHLPGGNDAILLRLTTSVPASVAVPAKVMTRLPSSSTAGEFFAGKPLEFVGFGGTGVFSNLGGELAGRPNCISHSSGELSCMARDVDGNLAHLQFDGSFQTIEVEGDSVRGTPSCVSWGPNRVDCFYRSTSDRLFQVWSTNGGDSFAGPSDLGGSIASNPSCVSWGSGRIDCFARGTNGQLVQRYYQNGWSSWGTRWGAGFVGAPSCVSWGPNRIDCFVRDTSNRLQHLWYRNSLWYGWQNLGGNIVSDPHCLSHALNNLDCFALSDSNTMQHRRYNGSSWLAWADRGGELGSAPECVSWGSNRLDCFARGWDSQLTHTWWSGSNWGAWEDLGSPIGSQPGCVSWQSGRLDCFATDWEGEMRHAWYDNSSWTDGVLASIRQIGLGTFDQMPCCSAPNKFLVDGMNDVEVRGGDSGGPLFVRDGAGERWVVAVLQGRTGDKARYIATFGTGGWGTQSPPILSASMRAWLESLLSTGTGTPID